MLAFFTRDALGLDQAVFDVDGFETAHTVHVENAVGGALDDGVHVVKDVRFGRGFVIGKDLRQFAPGALDLAFAGAIDADVDDPRHTAFAFVMFAVTCSASESFHLFHLAVIMSVSEKIYSK